MNLYEHRRAVHRRAQATATYMSTQKNAMVRFCCAGRRSIPIRNNAMRKSSAVLPVMYMGRPALMKTES